MANYLTYAPSATFDELLQLLPRWREGRLVELEAKAEQAVGEWDLHINRCQECLAFGEHLCAEGVYLTQDVVQRRSVLAAAKSRAAASPSALSVPTLDAPVGTAA
ncbi:MAG TPA: hypothetical protein VGU43_04760 [Thermoplasmata archaeon]|nr:hypothetical protein [Thermoplasmata archaeon]